MKKNIWIFNHYAGNMPFVKGGRHYWFADFLHREGYAPVVFCCNNRHNRTDGEQVFYKTERTWEEHGAEEIGTPFIYVKARAYQGNGKSRVLNMIDFYRNVKKAAREYAQSHGKPDVIFASSVHPLTLVAGLQLARKFKVKCICEVRDLWPEAIVAYSKRIGKNSLPAKLMYAGERWIYKKADALIFTQEGGADYIRAHGWDREHGGPVNLDKVHHINNGVDLAAFDRNLAEYWLDDADMDEAGTYKVVYTGAIRRINNLGLIVDAAKLIENSRIRFIIFGDGDELETLRKRVADENVSNVVFKGKVNKQYIPSVDARADLLLVHWEMNPLLRVGESYNKAFEYFAAGKPVFYTVRPGYSLVEKYGCGRLTEGFAPKDIAAGIAKMAAMSREETEEMCRNARKTAEIYDFRNLTRKLIEIVECL